LQAQCPEFKPLSHQKIIKDKTLKAKMGTGKEPINRVKRQSIEWEKISANHPSD
jgi:hypothetical protein